MHNVQTKTFLYFAYGSNMLAERLIVRCPSAEFVAGAIAPNCILSFGKSSNDGSGKANLVTAQDASTPGVLFAISEADRNQLDKDEGVNSKKETRYSRIDLFPVKNLETNRDECAMTYIAAENNVKLMPYDWYLALIVAGATKHDLLPNHIQIVNQSPYEIDNYIERPERLKAVCNMKEAGYENYTELLLAKK